MLATKSTDKALMVRCCEFRGRGGGISSFLSNSDKKNFKSAPHFLLGTFKNIWWLHISCKNLQNFILEPIPHLNQEQGFSVG